MGASESKLEFKEDIFRLAGEEVIPIGSQWWARFLQLPESAEDVQALWSPNDLRSLTLNTTADRPYPGAQVAPKKNAETLIYRTISRLYNLQTKRLFEDPNQPIAPEVLNGVRILTRLLPYIFEAEHLNDWEERFFWQPRKPLAYHDAKTNKAVYRDGLAEEKTIPDEQKDDDLGAPLGEQLVDILINYLFFPGFTLPARRDGNGLPELKPTYIVWQSGIGANKGAMMSKENEKNAVEVLRLLLALVSRPMYCNPNVVAERDIKPLTYLTTQSDRAIVLNTICSLLNTVLKYNQNPWSFPIDLGGTTKDSKQPLVTYCLQFLLVLITYPVPKNGANEFRKAVGRLHRAEDFQFIVEGLRQILMQPASGMFRPVQRLTTSVTPIAPETLALFWELLQCNRRFRSYLIDTDRARDFVVLVLYYAIEAKDDPARQGIVRMCIFILQTLSVEEKFGKKLNAPFTFQETLPAVLQIPNFHGSYADFLIGHIHTLLTSSNRGLESLHPALLAIINNVAPYLQGLERATSSMLLNIFVSFSSPSFLLANETNHVLLSSILDAMNAILEHQYQENRRFVELVVKSHKRFEALRDFTVEGALAELDKMTMERKDAGESTGVRSPARNASFESARSPTSVRATSLGDVPEDTTFAIGEDDEDDEVGSAVNRNSISSPVNTHSATVEDALPSQSRNMSEKARGKQPIGSENFSRTTSRNTSTSSLPSLSTLQTSNAQQFTPNHHWLHTWLPHLKLHKILNAINYERARVSSADTRQEATEALPTASTKHTEPESGTIAEEATKESKGAVKIQTFKWNSLAMGWYLSLIWSRIYASDAARVWIGTNIRLFNVLSQKAEISLRSPKGAVDAVGNTIAQRLGSISFSNSSPTMRDV